MDELSSLEGRIRHCIGPYKKGRCTRFAPGPGKPNARARKRAGITRPFYERSTTRKKAARVRVCRKIKGQKKRRCTWRYLTAAQARSTQKRTYRRATGGKGVYRASRKSRKVVSKRRKISANQLYRQAAAAAEKSRKLLARANKKAGGGSGPIGGLEGLRRRRATRRRRTRR